MKMHDPLFAFVDQRDSDILFISAWNSLKNKKYLWYLFLSTFINNVFNVEAPMSLYKSVNL